MTKWYGWGLAIVMAWGPAGTAGAAPIGVRCIQDLGFGKLAVGASGGTVTVTAAGSRTPNGMVWTLPGGSYQPALFTVTGDPSTAFAIFLPSQVTLSDGTQQMTLDGFGDLPADLGMIGGGGSALVHVGATLHLNARQHPGNYEGSFDVIVSYN